jgi:hypothetical protein
VWFLADLKVVIQSFLKVFFLEKTRKKAKKMVGFIAQKKCCQFKNGLIDKKLDLL